MTLIEIGKTPEGATVWLVTETLMETRLGMTASSGWGKSNLLRLIYQRTMNKLQQIIIDPEGEYPSLREQPGANYVIVGKHGTGADIPINVETAGELALKLLEENASAILDLSGLKRNEKLEFITAFCTALTETTSELWDRQCIIGIDEAHKFAPEKPKKGTAAFDCIEAITNLADAGRKRGLCLIVATQRLAKIEKDVFAECDNKMVGHTSYNDDRKRAAEELGDRSIIEGLKTIPKGMFYITGAAFKVEGQKGVGLNDVIQVLTPDVTSQLKKAGKRSAYVPPPSDVTKELIKKFSGLDEKVAKDKQDRASLIQKITQLERDLILAKGKPATVQASAEQLTGAYQRGIAEGSQKVKAQAEIASRVLHKHIADLHNYIAKVKAVADTPVDPVPPLEVIEVPGTGFKPIAVPHEVQSIKEIQKAYEDQDGELGRAAKEILKFLVIRTDKAYKVSQIAAMTGYAQSGNFRNAIGQLKKKELIAGTDDAYRLNMDNYYEVKRVLGTDSAITDTKAAMEAWLNRLGKAPKLIYEQLLKYPDQWFSFEEMAAMTGYGMGGNFRNAIGSLCTLSLAERDAGRIRLNPELLQIA